MINLDLSVGKKELLFGATYTVLGTLLARTVCHLSWKEAALWSGVGACVVVMFANNFGETIAKKAVKLSGVKGEDPELAVVAGRFYQLKLDIQDFQKIISSSPRFLPFE